jgi:hypothetical protein
MVMNTPLFEKYANLIRKRAHEYSTKYGIDYDEMESQGFLIYCECLEKYDISKAQFTTYLYIQLNRLGDYAKTYNRQRGVLIQDYYSNPNEEKEKDYETTLPAREFAPDVVDFLNEAKDILSDNAYNLMTWIVGRTWEGKNKRTPTVAIAVKYFNVSKQVIERAWEEIGTFWNEQGSAFYA